jgi:addiction module HigA family antidote
MARSAIHPGAHLAERLGALDMSAPALARRLGVSAHRIAGILNGRRAVSRDSALRLGRFFGNSPRFWLGLQALHDLRAAEERAGVRVTVLPTPGARQKALP